MAVPVIYGPDGQPVSRQALLTEQAAPSLASVRNIWSGHPEAGLTPARLTRILREAEQGNARSYYELAEAMEERDLHYVGVLHKRKQSVCQLDMTVEAAPGQNSAMLEEHANLVRDFIRRLELQGEIFDLLDAIGKGASHTEILWETSAAQWMPRELKWRDPRWFRFSLDDGETPELWDNAGYLPLAPYKFIIHKVKAKSGLPIRGGLARIAAWSYLFKNFDIKSWVQFVDTYGQPIRVGKYTPGATEEDKARLLAAVRNLAQDCAAIMPQSMMMELIEAKATGNHEVFIGLANYLDQQVSKAVLGNTGTTDAIAGGHAVGRVHRQVENDIETADARALEVTLNRDLVKPMVDLNYGPQRAYPVLRVVIPQAADALQLAQGLSILVDRGLKVGEADVRRALGYNEPQPGEPTLMPQSTPSPSPPNPTGGLSTPSAGGQAPTGGLSTNAANAALSLANPAVKDTDAIDHLIDEQMADWRELVQPLLAPIMDLAANATSYDQFLAGLPGLIPAQNSKALTEALARSLFAARLAGETEADLG